MLIIGCGDVGMRVVRALPAGVRAMALTSSQDRVPLLRAVGVTPLVGNLDRPQSLRRLAGLAHRVVHLAPPPSEHASAGLADGRTRALLKALQLRQGPHSVVYASTTGVYGDCAGAWIDESRACKPGTARGARRVDAERQMRAFGRMTGSRISILRIPGIYAPDRQGGTPRERLLRGTPALREEDDVYTNHIHADDLARTIIATCWRGRAQRVVNVSDDTDLRMGDYFDLAADLYGLPRPVRVSREEARERLSPMLMSFMSESRRLDNRRMKTELRMRLRYPTVHTGLRSQHLG